MLVPNLMHLFSNHRARRFVHLILRRKSTAVEISDPHNDRHHVAVFKRRTNKRFSNPKKFRFERPLIFAGIDRKSTRLNSSHQIISYAVFCLKKKTYRLSARNGKNRTLRPSKDHSTKRKRSRTRLELVLRQNGYWKTNCFVMEFERSS